MQQMNTNIHFIKKVQSIFVHIKNNFTIVSTLKSWVVHQRPGSLRVLCRRHKIARNCEMKQKWCHTNSWHTLGSAHLCKVSYTYNGIGSARTHISVFVPPISTLVLNLCQASWCSVNQSRVKMDSSLEERNKIKIYKGRTDSEQVYTQVRGWTLVEQKKQINKLDR